jgi:threonine dehydratase
MDNSSLVSIAAIEHARQKIAGIALRTPLVRFNRFELPAEIYLKSIYQLSFVDGIGSKTVFPQMLDRARQLIDGALVATLAEVAAAVRLLAECNHVIAEGAGACPVACASSGQAGAGKIVCIVSGGNIDTAKLCSILRQGSECS